MGHSNLGEINEQLFCAVVEKTPMRSRLTRSSTTRHNFICICNSIFLKVLPVPGHASNKKIFRRELLQESPTAKYYEKLLAAAGVTTNKK
jgi:hypothetical protein